MIYKEIVLGGGWRPLNVKFQDFDSIGDFNEYLNKTPTNNIFRGRRDNAKDSDGYFRGTSSYEEAEKLLREGWESGAQRIAKKLPVQTTQQTAMRSKPTYNVVGGQASVPRFLQGIPTNMVDRKQVPVKQKIIVLNRHIVFSGMTSKEVIEQEGIKALQVVQTLENRGYRVKLNLYWITQENNEACALRVCVKKPEERMSILKVAFPLAHPSFMRRMAFLWVEVHPTMTEWAFAGGYGRIIGERFKELVPQTEIDMPNFIIDIDAYVSRLGL